MDKGPFCCGWQVLAVLDSGRDLWVQYEDWMDGGVGVGTGRKYRDSNTLHSQAFWYNAMLD
jgi:actin-related protein 8